MLPQRSKKKNKNKTKKKKNFTPKGTTQKQDTTKNKTKTPNQNNFFGAGAPGPSGKKGPHRGTGNKKFSAEFPTPFGRVDPKKPGPFRILKKTGENFGGGGGGFRFLIKFFFRERFLGGGGTSRGGVLCCCLTFPKTPTRVSLGILPPGTGWAVGGGAGMGGIGGEVCGACREKKKRKSWRRPILYGHALGPSMDLAGCRKKSLSVCQNSSCTRHLHLQPRLLADVGEWTSDPGEWSVKLQVQTERASMSSTLRPRENRWGRTIGGRSAFPAKHFIGQLPAAKAGFQRRKSRCCLPTNILLGGPRSEFCCFFRRGSNPAFAHVWKDTGIARGQGRAGPNFGTLRSKFLFFFFFLTWLYERRTHN